MGCAQCGCPTPRARLCKQCAIIERADERAEDPDDLYSDLGGDDDE